MHATTRGRADVNPDPTADLTGKVTETAQKFIAGGKDRSYADRHKTQVRRLRLVGLAVFVPLWVLSVLPLARFSLEGREGTDALVVYLVVGALSLGIAAVIRGAYVLARKHHHFWSPWVFVVAVVVALLGYTVQSAGVEEPSFTSAPAGESRA